MLHLSRTYIGFLARDRSSTPRMPCHGLLKEPGWAPSLPFFRELRVRFSGVPEVGAGSERAKRLSCVERACDPGEGNPLKCPPAPDPSANSRAELEKQLNFDHGRHWFQSTLKWASGGVSWQV